MEEMTVEEITKKVQQLRKALNDSEAKIEVWKQNLDSLTSEYKDLQKKCEDEYKCSPKELDTLLAETKLKAEKLLKEALEEYQTLVNNDGTE